MKHIKTIIIACFSIGLLVYAYHHSLLIIRWPWHQPLESSSYHHATKKTIALHYWHHGSWHTEKNQLIITDNAAKALTYLINTWLTLLDEEKIMRKKIELQTALVSPTGHELFLSFDRTPFGPQQSTYEKWMWVEGLLKTIKAHTTSIDRVSILVRHKPLQDMHLDFSNAWPITGFLQ